MELKKIIVLWITVFFSASMALCFLGSIDDISKDFSISLSLSGQILSVYALSFAILGPGLIKVFGKFSYKISILTSVILLLFSNLLIAYIHDIKVFFIIRIISAGIASFLITKCFGYITEFSSLKKVGKNLGILYSAFAAANTFLIPTYSHISNNFGWRVVPQLLSASFIFVVILTVYCIEFDDFFIKNKIDCCDDYSKIEWYRNIEVIMLLFTTICILGSNMIFMGYIDPFLKNNGNNSVSIVLFIFGVGGILGSYISSKISNKCSEKKGLKIILIAYTLLLPIIYIFKNIYILSFLIFLWSVIQWASGPMIQKMLINKSRNNRESEKLLSLNMSFINFGISLGGILGGVAIKYSIQKLPLFAMSMAVLPILTNMCIRNKKE